MGECASIACAGTGIVYLRARDHFSLRRGRLFRQPSSSSQHARSKTCTYARIDAVPIKDGTRDKLATRKRNYSIAEEEQCRN